ncbi:MAG: bifunctional riboflavin kinase/FAD synthetase [Bryobacteraceae bacterium]
MSLRVYRSLEEATDEFAPSALTIGNFDGVHAGHRQILRRVAAVAAAGGWKPSVLTFDPHPTRVVAPSRTPALMTTPEARCALMQQEGIEQVLILPFNQSVAALTPRQFVAGILVENLGARSVMVGRNFRFGHKQAGDVKLLQALGRELGFETEVLAEVTVRGTLVSSSAIRKLVTAGEVSQAGRLLTRPFFLAGPVVRGRGVGSKETVPTLNLAPETELLPASGVYITRTSEASKGRDWRSVTNVGVRPTFGGTGLSIETFLLDGLAGDRPERIRVEFLKRLREERKFESAAELKAQILRDVSRAQAYFRRRERLCA